MINTYHEANRRRWDAGSASWAFHADTRGIWEKCHRDPTLTLHAAELKWLSDIAGKNVAVLGSGDIIQICAMENSSLSERMVSLVGAMSLRPGMNPKPLARHLYFQTTGFLLTKSES